jgi:phage tail protein X
VAAVEQQPVVEQHHHYAPTNGCTSAGGAFYYDKNANGSLADEKAVSPNPTVALDLADKTFGPTAYATIPLAIAGRGMVVPGSKT